MGKRKFLLKKKLGSCRVDVPLKRKIEYCKRIIELKEPYKVVKKLYFSEFGKPMASSTFDNWKKNGHKILSSDYSGINYRCVPKKETILEEFEKDVFKAVDSSTLDIEGIPGLNLEWIKIQANDQYKTVDVVQKLQFSNRYLVRLLRQYLIIYFILLYFTLLYFT
jgi:hypothetical protein